MDCEAFLEDYSDFLDRRFEAHPLIAYTEHILSCESCAEYDRVVRRGLRLVRQLGPPDTNPSFKPRLRRSLYELSRDGLGPRDYIVGTVLTAATAFGLLALAVTPTLRARSAVELPPVIVEVPAETPPPSLWGPVPRFTRPPAMMLAPEFNDDPIFAPPSDRVQLFRAPLRSTAPVAQSEEVAPE